MDITSAPPSTGNKAIRIITFLLLIPLAWLLADTIWLLYKGAPAPVVLPASMPVIEQAQSSAVVWSEERVESWHLFGKSAQSVPAAAENVPETTLKLELLGLFQTQSVEVAGAIIAEKGRESELYHTGDRLPGNAVLEEILADRVILSRRGKRETLRLVSVSADKVSFERVESPEEPPRQRTQVTGPGDDGEAAAGLHGDSARQRSVLISQLGLQPVEPGEASGYRIGPSAPGVVSSAGLQPGDIVLSVNGVELGIEENDVMALDSYKQSKSASVKVQRGQQTFTVSLPP